MISDIIFCLLNQGKSNIAANNATYTVPANITLTATATDSDGSITQVQFYDGATLLGTATQQPTQGNPLGSVYTFNWNNVPQGSYTNITAKATDNSGNVANNTATSAPIQLTVTQGVAQVYYIHTDQLNTPRLITNAANAKVWEWRNDDPFANNVPNDDPNSTGNHFTFNHRLPGQYADKETNTNYNYFRDYDPSTGRYIESDPIGLEGGINTYGYVGGNPLSYSDPRGLAYRWYAPGSLDNLSPYAIPVGNGSEVHVVPPYSGFIPPRTPIFGDWDYAWVKCECWKIIGPGNLTVGKDGVPWSNPLVNKVSDKECEDNKNPKPKDCEDCKR